PPYVLIEGVTLEEYECRVLLYQCNAITFTDAEVYVLGSALFKETCADGSGKEADASFRPEKITTIPPNGSNGNA
ncbi:1026_t:CDS:2, partial [Entrophospora sp. SA101]